MVSVKWDWCPQCEYSQKAHGHCENHSKAWRPGYTCVPLWSQKVTPAIYHMKPLDSGTITSFHTPPEKVQIRARFAPYDTPPLFCLHVHVKAWAWRGIETKVSSVSFVTWTLVSSHQFRCMPCHCTIMEEFQFCIYAPANECRQCELKTTDSGPCKLESYTRSKLQGVPKTAW